MFQTIQLVMWRFQMLIRNQNDDDAMTGFNFQNFAAFFIQQECCDVNWNLNMDRGRIFLHCLFLNNAQDLQCRGFGVADMTGAVTARTGHMAAFRQRRAQALTRQFHQTEAGNLAHLYTGAVVAQCIFQALFYFTLIFRVFHVDKIDHDQTTQIAQTQLTGHLFGSFQIGVQCGGFDVAATGCTRRVDVHRNQSFGMVNHDRAAARQWDCAAVSSFDLVLNLEA